MVMSLSTAVRVSTRLGFAGQPDVDHPAARLDQVQRQGGQAGPVGGVHDGIPAQGGQRGRGPHPAEPELAGEPQRVAGRAEQVHLGPPGRRELRHQQADGAGAEHQQLAAGRHGGSAHGAHGVPARLDQRAAPGVDGVGQRDKYQARHGQLLGQGARPAGADADS